MPRPQTPHAEEVFCGEKWAAPKEAEPCPRREATRPRTATLASPNRNPRPERKSSPVGPRRETPFRRSVPRSVPFRGCGLLWSWDGGPSLCRVLFVLNEQDQEERTSKKREGHSKIRINEEKKPPPSKNALAPTITVYSPTLPRDKQ